MDLTRRGTGSAPSSRLMFSDEALTYDTESDDAQPEVASGTEAACPVQAIRADRFRSAHADASGWASVSGSAVPAQRTSPSSLTAVVEAFRRSGRIVTAGASLGGLRTAAVLRGEGFAGSLTLIGDKPHQPYDCPPLSKQVLDGLFQRGTPCCRGASSSTRGGCWASRPRGWTWPASRYAQARATVEYDRLLIARGTRARPWPGQTKAEPDGVCVLHTRDDTAGWRRRLADRPRRMLVIGGGVTGCEVASACRDQDVPVTVAEPGPVPLAALGEVIGAVAGGMQRENGIDLRSGVTVTSLGGRRQRPAALTGHDPSERRAELVYHDR